jgi:uncharacterized protein (DUF433 family)
VSRLEVQSAGHGRVRVGARVGVRVRQEPNLDEVECPKPFSDDDQAPKPCGTFKEVTLGSAMEIFPGISMNPDVRFGKPCITGTRMDVATVVGLIAAGETVETVVDEYQLSLEQVRSALSYAAHVAAHLPPAVRQAS